MRVGVGGKKFCEKIVKSITSLYISSHMPRVVDTFGYLDVGWVCFGVIFGWEKGREGDETKKKIV